ncbi:uncharacterized protein LOC111830434 [Capsella rubella]|uniref:uncharacterized protein LOC111830434 n=1 Tax=Capsella rubella TaxID=81985 RepID=UPI000CD52AA5|nr:uncharacterized protein LOC111830434 [Capsella rubella]
MVFFEALSALASATVNTINYVGTAKAAVNVAMDVFNVAKTVAGAISDAKSSRGRKDDVISKDVTQMTQADDFSLTQAEKKDILFCLLAANRMKQESSSFSQSYEEKYMQTQRELSEAKLKIQELDKKYEDIAYWSLVMTQLHPYLIPPSRRNQTYRTE